MSNNLPATQHFRILPSTHLKTLFDVLHVCAILACWLNGLSNVFQWGFTAGILAFWYFNTKRWKRTPVYLVYHDATGWEISDDGVNYVELNVLPSTVISNSIIFLHYRIKDKTRQIPIVSNDSLKENDFRRLSVRLKISGSRLAR